MKLILILVLTNFIIFFIVDQFSLQRDLINIDYFICLLLIFLKLRKLAIISFCIFFLSDLVLVSRQIFPFFRVDDILYILKFTFIASFYYKIILFSIMIYIIFISYFLYKSKRNNIQIYIVFILIIAFLVQNIFNVVYEKNKSWLTSQITNFIEIQTHGFSQNLRMKAQEMQNLPYSPASQHLFSALNNQNKLNHDVLFIVNESLGVPQDQVVLDEILSHLFKKNNFIHDLKISKTGYVGPTVYGELRELCHSQPQNFNLKDLQIGFENCLPYLFKKQGYETKAIHGALGIMYDRKYWYPKVGFDQITFYESRQWERQCYSFPGACDREIAQYIKNYFKDNNKFQFVYWLTLNSHSVYDERDIFYNVFDCKKFNIQSNTESCRNLRLQAQFFYVLADLIKSIQVSKLEVVIVGDHAPVILNKREQDKYFKKDDVLMINFMVYK